ncbi:lipopolysaccharide biosynthesis protein [Microbacterium sp. NPDC058062]|uniref:lipopolysaccharide biosynthesis protein n=1 Tax=Microbacterium sp. NPDC058062 TaxID=3346320 RepID=UPI0036DD9E3B
MRRILHALRRHGVIDGMWTLAASVGSKIQTLVLLAIAGRLGGIEIVGATVLATSIAVLVASVCDLGLSTQGMRWFAVEPEAGRRGIRNALVARSASAVPIAGIVAWFFFAHTYGQSTALLWAAAVAAYAGAFCASFIATNCGYGSGRFKGAATLNGTVRSASVVVLLGVGTAGLPAWSLILVLALAEVVIAFAQYKHLPTGNGAVRAPIALRQTWQYAVGPIANNLMNRSDSVVVAAFSSATVVGFYGLASQLQNALTTVALIPSGASVAYAARAESANRASRQLLVVSSLVATIYVVVATPFFLWPTDLCALVFGVSDIDALTIRICLVAGIFSCVAGVAMQVLTGVGDRAGIATIWALTAIVAIVLLAFGAKIFGAPGAAVAALVRDILFLTATLVRSHTWRRRHG